MNKGQLNNRHLPELLLPVGSKEMCLAAIHNGADAVYIGAPEFNARGRSKDFAIEELKEMVELCHLYGVKVHLALNVLIFEHELPRVRNLVRELLRLGPDAFIIQDIGLATLVRQISPDVPIHASTQMTVTNYEAIELLQDLGIQRFVLGREVSLSEMELIRQRTPVELEVFVHGALCVAYSGQCFTSEGIGGRSANRGQCAQSCRLEYDLIVDGQKRDLENKRYLVSPQDLCGLDDVGQLIQLGIHSFKVEGRLKSPEYVAQVAQAYDQARLQALTPQERDNLKRRMGLTYSRGFFSGWLHGVNHQKLVDATYSSHRGLLIGRVLGTSQGQWLIKSSVELRAGQGLLLAWNEEGQKREMGGKIASVERWNEGHRGKGTIQKAKGPTRKRQIASGEKTKSPSADGQWMFRVSLWEQNREQRRGQRLHKVKDKGEGPGIPQGAQVYLNSDPQLDRELQQSFHARESLKRITVRMRLNGRLGTPLILAMSDGDHEVQVETPSLLVASEKTPLTPQALTEVMGQLGGTCFQLPADDPQALEISLEAGLFLHMKEIKELRQRATKELALLRMKPRSYTIHPWPLSEQKSPLPIPQLETAEDLRTGDMPKAKGPLREQPRLRLLVRTKSQVEDLIHLINLQPEIRQTLSDIILDYEFGKDYAPSLEALRDQGLSCGIATTRILKPKEYHHLKVIERLGPEVVLIRNLGALNYLTSSQILTREKGTQLIGDFSLNATNHLTYRYLLSKGLSTICASYDLSASQLKDLVQSSRPESIEVTLHQYMPLFHMEHCVFAAFLSSGSSFRDCGRPCERHRVELRDAYGQMHFLKADQECRNTMFHGKAQSAALLAQDLKELGVRHFRLELLDERGEILQQKVQAYFHLLRGEASPMEVFHSLGVIEHYGVNSGTLGMERSYQDRKKI